MKWALYQLLSLVYVVAICATEKMVVPLIVHQVYDYRNPNFFMYLSLKCVQRYLKPKRHLLWVNSEGRYRMGFWESWLNAATPGSWEEDLKMMIKNNTIEPQFLVFPSHPPNNDTLTVLNHAYRSDFTRMDALVKYGGIYLDTDAFVFKNMDVLRVNHFTISLNNLISERIEPLQINNGVMLSSPNSSFVQIWMKKYSYYQGYSWDRHWNIIGLLATQNPDLLNIEMNRIAPLSYMDSTALAAQYLTCGLYLPHKEAIWGPRYDYNTKTHTFIDTKPNSYVYEMMHSKFVLHMTTSQVRFVSMIRKTLSSPSQLELMPSMLGHIFREAYFGEDKFNYTSLESISDSMRLKLWEDCRAMAGIQAIPERDMAHVARQQFMAPINLTNVL